MFAGWRGAVGRSIPRGALLHALQRYTDRIIAEGDTTIRTLQEQNRRQTRRLADDLSIDWVDDPNSERSLVGAADWPVLADSFRANGYEIHRLSGVDSYAAEAVYSVGDSAKNGSRSAQRAGLGAIWQVRPGQLQPSADAQDFVGTIDAVYTWVDSSDPHWQANYHRAVAGAMGVVNDSSVDPGRFESRDELRYSLRSLESHLPWVNKVYLVTAGQRPEWLVDAHPRLEVIDHRDIFASPEQCLPTFNSHAIESQLSRIDGLSEHFLYVNDDVFFGRPLHPNLFFGPAGQTKYALTNTHFTQAEERDLPVNAAAANNRELVATRYERTTSRKFKHVAHPQRRTVLQKIAEEFADDIEATAAHRFRHPDDISIPSSLAHQVAARMGLGFPTDVDYSYLDIGADDFLLQCLRLWRTSAPDMFCINEVRQPREGELLRKVLQQVLHGMYPVPSSFER